MKNLGHLGRPVALLCSVLALGLPIAACGGSSADSATTATTHAATTHAATIRTATIHTATIHTATTHTTADSPASGAHAPASNATGSGSRTRIVTQCAAQANGDPGAMGLCLASHGVRIPDGGKIYACLQSANTRADVTACLAQAARS